MTIRPLLAVVVSFSLAIAGVLTAPHLGRAQDDLFDIEDEAAFEAFMAEIKKDKADQKRCRGKGDVRVREQEAACTRLIENAPNENDLVGEYYVDRAMTREDDADKCRDVRKGIAIIERSKSTIYGQGFLDSAGRLEKAVCE